MTKINSTAIFAAFLFALLLGGCGVDSVSKSSSSVNSSDNVSPPKTVSNSSVNLNENSRIQTVTRKCNVDERAFEAEYGTKEGQVPCEPVTTSSQSVTHSDKVSGTDTQSSATTSSSPLAGNCAALWYKMKELEPRVEKHEETARYVSEQTERACKGNSNSTKDCQYWTEKGRELEREAEKLRPELGQLMGQFFDNGCYPR